MNYFDWNATAPLRPCAKEAMLTAYEELWYNPSTSYRLGARAKNALDQAREDCATLLGGESEDYIFTSGATESNNILFREVYRILSGENSVLISAIEHPSVREAAYAYWGNAVVEIPVLNSGIIDLGEFEKLLAREKPVLVSVMAANNETGVIQPWEKIKKICQKEGILFHTDAVQWVGKKGIQGLSGCDFVTISGHKFGGPRGVGLLKINSSFRGIRGQFGGTQENDHRGGTENTPAILGMLAALKESLKSTSSELVDLGREVLIDVLRSEWDDLKINGESSERLGDTVSLLMPEGSSSRWISKLDQRGFAVSSGAACSAGQEEPSKVLATMGLSPSEIKRSIRISGGYLNSAEDWKALAEAMIQIRTQFTENPSSKVIDIDNL